jgi:hypothetical protein
MEYIVLWEDTPERLARIVNKFISEGWKPQGGVSVTVYYSEERKDSVYTFSQAMVNDTDTHAE